MQKLKAALRKVISPDFPDIYRQENPTKEDFFLVIHSFQQYPASRKTEFSESLARKLSREHNNLETLNLLILCDFLSATNPFIFCQFPSKLQSSLEVKRKVRGASKQQKIRLAQSNFNYFYLEYLREKVWGAKALDNISIGNLAEGHSYCDSALTALKLVIRHDFIIQYTLSCSQSKGQARIAVENMLRRSSEDVAVVMGYVDKWSHVILQQRPQSVMVNDIYEQLIFVSKNIHKLQYLNNRIKGQVVFPKYQINKSLNCRIEKSMVGRDNERRQFYSQRRLKTEGDLNEEQAEITESQIYMKLKL